MTERGRRALQARHGHTWTIGPSALAWDGTALTIGIDEITRAVPVAHARHGARHPGGAHRPAPSGWTRAAAIAGGRSRPARGSRSSSTSPACAGAATAISTATPATSRWKTAFTTGTGRAPAPRDGSRHALRRARRDGGHAVAGIGAAIRTGSVEQFEPPPRRHLPTTRWLARGARAPGRMRARPRRWPQTLEDAPFYARSVLATHLLGEPVTADAREPVARPLPHRLGPGSAAVPDAAGPDKRRVRVGGFPEACGRWRQGRFPQADAVCV